MNQRPPMRSSVRSARSGASDSARQAAARWLARGINPYRMAGRGILAGIAAFCMVIFADPMGSTALFFAGATSIGFGGGLFAVSTLTAAMTMPAQGLAGRGLALGAWGAAQATAAGVSTLISGAWGPALNDPATGYSLVYHVEVGLLFVTLIALGPLVTMARRLSHSQQKPTGLGLADFPT